jgi:protein SCO1
MARGCLIVALLGLLPAVSDLAADRDFPVRGMVLSVDPVSRTMVVSHEAIAGLMDAMTMPFEVRGTEDLRAVVPGAVVEFTLVVGDSTAHARDVRVRRYESVEQDPVTARRLTLLKRIAGMAATPLAVGARVPDFTLTDQSGRTASLSSLAGKVVVVNFVYTRCVLPQFCLRVTNHFGVLQKRFAREMGRELALLTITFDPERDTPEVLAAYAARWNADPASWRFLTGEVNAVRRVCGLFGVEAFLDEGLFSHTLRTAVIDRRGTLAANIEGNHYTAEQLGDLVQVALTNGRIDELTN